MYKSKDDENISRTMQDKKMEQKKSGIYMDRMDGALPQNRVSKYYQDTNPKPSITDSFSKKDLMNDIEAVGSFVAGGGPIKHCEG